MRARKTHQMNLFSVTVRHEIGKELEVISEILDQNPDVLIASLSILPIHAGEIPAARA